MSRGDASRSVPPEFAANVTVSQGASCTQTQISGQVKVEIEFGSVGTSLPSVGFSLTSPSLTTLTATSENSTSPIVVETFGFTGEEIGGIWQLIVFVDTGSILLNEAVMSFTPGD